MRAERAKSGQASGWVAFTQAVQKEERGAAREAAPLQPSPITKHWLTL